MTDMILYIGNRNYSSWSLRAWLCARQCGAAFSTEVIALDQPDTPARLAAVSPGRRVPALHHGERVVWESLAIAEYLAECFPEAGLWPADVADRALARAVSAEMHAGFAALRAQLPMDMRSRYRDWPRLADPAVTSDLERIGEIVRCCRARECAAAGPFLFGTPGIADAMYAPVASRMRTYRVVLDDTVDAWCTAVMNSEAMREWYGQAEIEPWTLENP